MRDLWVLLPGTPVIGRTPLPWLPMSQAPVPELQGLMREARVCDVEMFIIENTYDSKVGGSVGQHGAHLQGCIFGVVSIICCG